MDDVEFGCPSFLYSRQRTLYKRTSFSPVPCKISEGRGGGGGGGGGGSLNVR